MLRWVGILHAQVGGATACLTMEESNVVTVHEVYSIPYSPHGIHSDIYSRC